MNNKPKVLDAFIVIALFVAAAFYFVVTLSTNDPAWVWPYFSGKPSRIVLHSSGQDVEILPGSPEYEAVNAVLNQALSKVQGYSESLGLSEESLVDYRTRYVSLEIFYPEPVVVHSRFNFGRPNTLLIPLTGWHSRSNAVFGGHNGNYWAGALNLKDLQPLKEMLAELGYWQGG